MKKLAIFAMAALTMVACNKNNPDEPKNDDPKPTELTLKLSGVDQMAQGMSPDHKYVVGQTVGLMPFFWDLTGKQTELTTSGALYAVNNQGVAVGTLGESNQFAFRYENGNITNLTTPAGSYGSAAWDITDDGQIMVGFYYDAAYKTTPCYWTADGQLHDLPVPTSVEAGFEVNGAATRWVSADGKVVLGFLMDNFSTWPAIIWNQQADGSYAFDIVCKDYFEDDCFKGKPYMTFGCSTYTMALSPNGEWLALTVQEEYDANDWEATPSEFWGARLNLKTKQLEVCKEVSTLTAIANDGTAIGYEGDSPTQRTAYVWLPGEKSGKEFASKYAHDELKSLSSISPMDISADASAVCGFAVMNGAINSFVLY